MDSSAAVPGTYDKFHKQVCVDRRRTYMDMSEANTNGSNVLGNPLRYIVHFFEGTAALGQGTSDLVY